MADLFVVTRQMPELEEDAGAGNTETEAPESPRKFLKERESLRYRREGEVPAGRKNVSFRRPVSFPTRRRVVCTSRLCLRVFGETNMWWRQTETSVGSERQPECWNVGRRWIEM